MTTDRDASNRRILIIDDNVNIHEDFRKILSPPIESGALDQARAALFGETPTLPTQVSYELEFANQGRAGFGLVQTAHQKGTPYAAAFVDMRMPPGWDGLETIEHLWYVDPEIQVVICSAYSDHPWEDVSRRIGDTDKLLILMKPFSSIEVVQLANALTKKWNLARAVKQQINDLGKNVSQRTTDVRAMNQRLQEHIATRMMRSDSIDAREPAGAMLREKEEFFAIMSHEILTPMNELIARVSLLRDSPLNSVQRQHASTLDRCAQDLLSLIKDMHEFLASPRHATEARDHLEG
ncbi:MAG TPA: histidine kinase dimerization/phospho-acceptor domain-containing protein [Nitrospira sp.]|nr:histidine kinase dimerization/phospho-acceptor domain-containing protein [Nitrospira sp.]